MRFLLVSLLLLFACPVFAQTKRDSLLTRIKTQKEDTNLVNSYIELAEIAYSDDLKAAIKYSHKALEIAKKIRWQKGMAEAYGWLGYLYDHQGEIEKAFAYEIKGLEARRKVGDINLIAASLNNLGYMYEEQGDLDEAMKMYKECYRLMLREENIMALGVITNNIGFIYWEQAKFDSAYHYQNQGLEYKKKMGDPLAVAFGQNNVARSLMSLGDSAKALSLLFESEKTFDSLRHKAGRSLVYGNLAHFYEAQRQFRKAYDYARKSYDIATEIRYSEKLESATGLMYRLSKALGKTEDALKYYEEYIGIRDSIRNSGNEKLALRHQMDLKHQKELSDIATKQARKDARDQADKERQQYIMLDISIGLAGFIVFSIILFNRLKLTRKQKTLIEQKNGEMQEQRDLIATKNAEITDSINYARRLQDAILPPKKELEEAFNEAFVLYKPKDIVSGDFYWMEQYKNKVYLAVADCTGHGVPGAMVSVVCSNALSKSLIEEGITEPGKILDRARELVVGRFGRSKTAINDGMDISLFAYDPASNTLEWAGAHNPLWIIRAMPYEQQELTATLPEGTANRLTSEIQNGRTFIEIRADKQPIGNHHTVIAFTNHCLQLEKGDALYLFTDGFADQFGGDQGKKFKSVNFKKLLASVNLQPMSAQATQLDQSFEAWRGKNEQVDDVCVVGVKL